MAKHNLEWNENKLKRFLKEGRGQGIGKDYKPWLTIQDIPSLGRVSRLYGYKTGRIHHFFSDIQTRYFYLLEWEDNVIDIREHYPLLDLRETLDNEDLDLEKYKSEDGTDYVFTSTFLIDVKDRDGSYKVARTLKASHELERKSIIERFEIERRYWKNKNIDWGVVTNKETPKLRVKNIEWVHSSLELDKNELFTVEEKTYLCRILLSQFCISDKKARKILQDFDMKYNLQEGTGLLLFKYLIAKKIVIVNMDEKINLNLSVDAIIRDINEKGADTGYVSNSEHASSI